MRPASGIPRQASGVRRARVLVRLVTDLPSAVEEALDFLEFDFRDKRVWVKPNLLGAHLPERSVTTDPELVRCCVRGLRSRGASAVWVADNPGGGLHGDVASFLAPTGIIEASEGCFRSIGATPADLPLRSDVVPSVPVSPILFEADVVLNLPVFKTHALTLLTGAVKNLFGIIPGGHKARLHEKAATAERFARLLVDICAAVPRPVLSIMDALRGMDGQSGPGSGRVLRIGKLLASANAVALDSVMALMAGTRPAAIPMLRIAGELGLGPIDPDSIDIIGDFERIRGFRLPVPGLAGPLVRASRLFYALVRHWPLLRPGLCTRCGTCAANCPVRAIVLNPLPSVDRDRCIACFCCVETCPEHAMLVPTGRQALRQRITGR